ncbi:MAG: hypothetical protein DGJ47_000293 [Rickettsiaceae bacterium]
MALMLNNFVLSTAFRYFRAKKNEKFVSIISAISLIGITIGVAALIIVMSVMNGFHIELTNNIVGLNGDVTLSPYKNKEIENHQNISERIKNYSFVTKIHPLITGQGLALGRDSNSGVLIKGIDLSSLKHKGEITKNVMSGDFVDYFGNDRIAIGSELAVNLGIHVGSKIKLIAPNLISTVFGSMPRTKTYTVIAIFSSGMYDYDAATILMPLSAARLFFSFSDNSINSFEVNVNDPNKASEYAHLLQKDLGSDIYVQNWMNSNRQFLQALEVERVAMFTILSLIILVAAFNIVSSLFMIVKDKTKDIAILKTIGASNRQIMLIFMINGTLIGVIGTITGMICGLLFSYNIESVRNLLESFSGVKLFDPAIYFLYSLPSSVELYDVFIVALLSIILSIMATIYPAYRAAKLNPIEAMRYE